MGGSGAAHADADAVLLEFCGVVARSILHAAIGVMHQPWFRPAMPQRHAQGLQRQDCFQVPLQGPAETTPRECIQQNCQINKFQPVVVSGLPIDTPTDISCGSSASPTARTRLFVYWILLGREVDFLRQPLEFWLISYAIVRR